MLEPLSYIVEAGIIGAPVEHEWLGTVHYNREDARLLKHFAGITPSALLALALGIGEWVYWRFDPLAGDRSALQLIESGWAFTVDPAYTRIWDKTKEPKRHDTVGGPLYALKERIASLLFAELARREDPEDARGGPARRTVELAYLARHVVPNRKAFDGWLKRAIARLGATHPGTSADPYGPVVPREALDPAVPYNPEQSAASLAKFIGSLEPAYNPYLRPAREMQASGFKGMPYRIEP